MRRTARLMIAAFALLGAMTAGAFAASSSGGRPPGAVDLPKIVTALTIPATATTDTIATTLATTRPSATTAPTRRRPRAARAASSWARSPSRAAKAAAPPAAAPTPGGSKSIPGAPSVRDDHPPGPGAGDHEVVTPPLHESDGHGGGGGEPGHPKGN